MSDILRVLNRTNRTLSSRIPKGKWTYILWTAFISIFLLTVIIINFFGKAHTVSDFRRAFQNIPFFVVYMDLVAILMRIQSRTFIEPYQLSLFPISKWTKLKFHILLFLLDYKTIIYLAVSCCFVVFYVKNGLYLSAFFSIFIWGLLLIIILTWSLVLYGIFGKYLDRMGNKMQMLTMLFISLIVFMQFFGKDLYSKIPVTRNIGNILYGLWSGELHLIWMNLLIVLGVLLFPLLLFAVLKTNSLDLGETVNKLSEPANIHKFKSFDGFKTEEYL